MRIEFLRNFERSRHLKREIERIRRRFDEDAAKTIEQVLDYTMVSPERLYSLIEATRYVNQWKIPGAIVECGVWRGGASMTAALTLLQLSDTSRNLFLYDTFSGMTAPTEKDFCLKGESDVHEVFRATQTGEDESSWCRAGLTEVKQNLTSTGYPISKLKFIKGKVEETLPEFVPESIAILRLDTDWYDSTRHELVHLYPLLVSGGVIIIDDYNTWAGSKLATDEYFSSINVPIFLKKVDESAIGVKAQYSTKVSVHAQ